MSRLTWSSKPVAESGCLSQLPDTPPPAGSPALFLDRDGVIVEDCHYLSRPQDIFLIDGVAAAIADANELGIPVIVTTNQSGIGRGYYGWDDFHLVQGELSRLLAGAGARLDAVFACPFHVDAIPPYRLDNHPWRKPNPGMILQAQALLELDLSRSIMVGDALTDILAARRAGLGSAALVRTGHGARDIGQHRQVLEQWRRSVSPRFNIYDDAADAILDWLPAVPSRSLPA